jgi:hypothetical protein
MDTGAGRGYQFRKKEQRVLESYLQELKDHSSDPDFEIGE